MLNKDKRTYYATVNLKEGENFITAIVFDMAGRKTQTTGRFYAKSTELEPAITIQKEKDGTISSRVTLGDKMLLVQEVLILRRKHLLC